MGGKMKNLLKLLVVALFCLCASPMYAGMVHPEISAVSAATLLTEGEHAGWYLYEIDFQWDFGCKGHGLSHWDLILKDGCANKDHLIVFDRPAGFSTSRRFPCDANSMSWTGYFNLKGDHSVNVHKPLIKYDSPHIPERAKAGPQGHGKFSFYSNIIPEYGTFSNALVAKEGRHVVYGDLRGAYPSCKIIPEPATIAMLGLGNILLLRRKR
jgi:hypothetical protein